jgi:hypothetical protein
MRQKLLAAPESPIEAPPSGDRRRQDFAGRQADGRRRPRLTDGPDAHRRKPGSGRRIRPRALTFVQPNVVDDFPQAIPVISRELDVIETYLGALLDHALGIPKSSK